MNLTIIIPTLNEQTTIVQTLTELQKFRSAAVEIIVVDGGSTDGTKEIIENLADQIVVSECGRAVQMNHGAKLAKHDCLMFLHSDTLLSDINTILNLPSNSVNWGFFTLLLQPKTRLIALVTTLINFRSRHSKIATGDQAIWVSRLLFNQLRGFEAIELMEDVALCKRLKAISKPIICSEIVTSSSRRWLKHGVIRTIIKMWIFRLAYFMGVSPRFLASRYHHAR